MLTNFLQNAGMSTAATNTFTQALQATSAAFACACDMGFYGSTCDYTSGISACFNSKLDPGESDVDCGGPCQTKCPESFTCGLPSDCIVSTDCVGGTCVSSATPTPLEYALVLPLWFIGVDAGSSGAIANLAASAKSLVSTTLGSSSPPFAVRVVSNHKFYLEDTSAQRRMLKGAPQPEQGAGIINDTVYALKLDMALSWQELNNAGSDSAAASIGYSVAQAAASIQGAASLQTAAAGTNPGYLLKAIIADAENAQVLHLVGSALADLGQQGSSNAQVLDRPSSNQLPVGDKTADQAKSSSSDSGTSPSGAVATGVSIAGTLLVVVVVLLAFRWRAARRKQRSAQQAPSEQPQEGSHSSSITISPLHSMATQQNLPDAPPSQLQTSAQHVGPSPDGGSVYATVWNAQTKADTRVHVSFPPKASE